MNGTPSRVCRIVMLACGTGVGVDVARLADECGRREHRANKREGESNGDRSLTQGNPLVCEVTVVPIRGCRQAG